MKIVLKISIVLSVLLIYLGFFGEELIASFHKSYDRCSKSAVTHIFAQVDENDPLQHIQALKAKVASVEFYSDIEGKTKMLACLGLVIFFTAFMGLDSLSLVERRRLQGSKRLNTVTKL